MKQRVVALVVLSLTASVSATQSRDLTFEERVRAQEAIDRVYYSHRIGATSSFEKAVPRARLERKVTTYLKQSAALKTLWKTAVTQEALERELVRMAAGTRMPERLQEIHAALGNDPFLVAECFARPILVDRLARSFAATETVARKTWEVWWSEIEAGLDASTVSAVAGDLDSIPGTSARAPSSCLPDDTWDNGSLDDIPEPRYGHVAVWTGTEMIVWGGADDVYFTGGSRYDPTTDTWTPMSRVNAPQGRIHAKAVWTGSKMLVWGGDVGSPPLNTGGRYDPALDSWEPISPLGAPTARTLHTVVWTGTEMIVWGGSGDGPDEGTGGRYDPASDTWTPTQTAGAPSSRAAHVAVWTGDRMIVWGQRDDGGRYDPVTDTWTPTSTSGMPPVTSYGTAVWTGSRMIVWGGQNFGFPQQGGLYDPVADTWTLTTMNNAPAGRTNPTAIWTGTEMLIWGGWFESPPGARYDPAADTWTSLSTAGAPLGDQEHTAVWTGSRMIVWGGLADSNKRVNTGGRYDPASETWTPTRAITFALGGFKTAVWTGTEMIVWGDRDSPGSTGGRYDPATDNWAPVTTVGQPETRYAHSAVWTGAEMIVWGGYSNATGYHRSGGRYDPANDSWTLTSLANAPDRRYYHAAVWTGSRMIVWGGTNNLNYYNTGGIYEPSTNSWTATSTTGAPTGRYQAAAVWTGDRMLVWGGFSLGSDVNTGGRYDPVTDSWTATSTTNAPPPRSGPTAVWTGNEMIVWGGSGSSNTGGRYDPAADTWESADVTGAPQGRTDHTAVWTGARMIVWGGSNGGPGGGKLGTGGAYDPETDSWMPTSTASPAPAPRYFHVAVWTGNHMIVWGGAGSTGAGGRYVLSQSIDHDGDGFSACAGDCNDSTASAYPGAAEVCDGIDNDCDLVLDEDIPAPSQRPALSAGKAGASTALTWTIASGATGYDVVKGNLGPLRNSQGNFTSATKACIANDLSTPAVVDAEVPPPSGGLWFVVRAVNACGGDGSYDEPGSGQPASRDAEIDAAGNSCP